MAIVSKDSLREMAQRMVPRIAPKDVSTSEQQRVAENKLELDAKRMLKEMLGQ